MSRGDQENRLTLTDNGQGAEQITFGFGLTTLRDQVQALNGTLSVTTAPGQGTTLQVTLPKIGAS